MLFTAATFAESSSNLDIFVDNDIVEKEEEKSSLEDFGVKKRMIFDSCQKVKVKKKAIVTRTPTRNTSRWRLSFGSFIHTNSSLSPEKLYMFVSSGWATSYCNTEVRATLTVSSEEGC